MMIAQTMNNVWRVSVDLSSGVAVMPIVLMDNSVTQVSEHAYPDRTVLATKIAPMMNGVTKAYVSPFLAETTQIVTEEAHVSHRDACHPSSVMMMLTVHFLS